MCNNPRPQNQYQNLLEIRDEGRRQRILQEEQDRQFAMNSNVNSIKYQNALNTEIMDKEDEEEAAKKLLEEDNGEEWGDEDFKDDDDEDWGDDNNDNNDNNNNSCIEMEDCEEYEDDDDDDDDDDDGDNNSDDDGWGDADITEQTVDIDMKMPEKMRLYEVLNPYKLKEHQLKFMKDISEQLYMSNMDDIGIMCRYYRWNKNELMDEYLSSRDSVLAKCGIISSNKSLSKPLSEGTFDCWLCIQTLPSCKDDTFYPEQCGHQYCNECWRNYLVSQMEKGPRVVQTKCIDPKCGLCLRPSVFIQFLPYKYRLKFEEYILHSFVSGLNTLQWCPGKECVNAVKAEYGSPITIDCPSCNALWCFACLMGAHLPCNCELATKWMKLHSTDSENITWVRAYTKECPKCKNHIEKNQGCNHMTWYIIYYYILFLL